MSVVLAVNAGSSSLKMALHERSAEAKRLASGVLKLPEGQRLVDLVEPLLTQLLAQAGGISPSQIEAIGHRIVHGGESLSASVIFDAATERELEVCSMLAPLHNPPALEALRALAAQLPGLPQACVFDTAYYSTLPESEVVLPLPYSWYAEWRIRRFGFHGISHAHMATRAAALCPPGEQKGFRVISLHLGAGCSATASLDGKAAATTMGYTPMDGLMMATRPGALDPGVLIAVLKQRRLTVEQLENELLHGSGLKGVSGSSGDYRMLDEAAAGGDSRAALALTLFSNRVREQIGAFYARLGGAEAIVFSGGIGENSAKLRAEVCCGLESMGIKLDSQANAAAQGEYKVSLPHSTPTVLVVPADEERFVAKETIALCR